MAQWIAHWTSNPEVAGSNPVKSVEFYFVTVKSVIMYILIRDGVVGNISACHADARGSIPRRGGLLILSMHTHTIHLILAAAC